MFYPFQKDISFSNFWLMFHSPSIFLKIKCPPSFASVIISFYFRFDDDVDDDDDDIIMMLIEKT